MTYCNVMYIDENNDKKEEQVLLFGDYDISTAQNAALKKLNAKGGVVTEVFHSSFYGTMSLEEFANHCTKKDFKEW